MHVSMQNFVPPFTMIFVEFHTSTEIVQNKCY